MIKGIGKINNKNERDLPEMIKGEAAMNGK
jgi:hypothetical protein